MEITAASGGGIVELPRPLACQGDQLLEVSHRQCWMHHQEIRRQCEHRDGLEILDRIVIEILVDARDERMTRGGKEQRVAVGFRLRNDTGAQRAAGARTRVDENVRTEGFSELVGKRAGQYVGPAAWREWNNEAYGFLRIAIRGRGPQRGWPNQCDEE